MNLHPIPPGLFCVPSALVALTGADYESVLFPALNRAAAADTLLGPVGPAYMDHAYTVLQELDYTARRYKGTDLRARLSTWATRSQFRYPSRALLVSIRRHALVIKDGQIFDTLAPAGAGATLHPQRGSIVLSAALIEKR